MDNMLYVVGAALAVILFVIVLLTLVARYRMCPPDQILVVYGKLANGHLVPVLPRWVDLRDAVFPELFVPGSHAHHYRH
ncbi:MAG: hypothetical protein QM760_22095 [Nibricoccus sp.]